MSNQRLYVAKNLNRRHSVAEEYMAIIGASTGGILTGQGLGTKLVGIRSAIDGLVFGRASHDSKGPYLAWYETEVYDLDGETSERAVLVVQRPSGTTRQSLAIDTNFVMSAWSKHPLGDAYPTAREIILDAVDEDPGFRIEQAEEMCYSDEGETWTFFEETRDISSMMNRPGRYFHRGDGITWLTKEIGVTPSASLNEARFFVTAGENPTLAYAAWSSGISPEDAVPDAAYDYVLWEDTEEKWASMPKRIVEDVAKAQKTICEALMKTENVEILARVFANIINGGWESNLPWKTFKHYWDETATKQALAKAVKSRPVHYNDNDDYFMSATLQGFSPIAVPSWMYEIAKMVSYRTVMNMLNVRDAGEVRINPPTTEQMKVIRAAHEFLTAVYPWTDWGKGHVFKALQSDGQESAHTSKGGTDTIAINFDKAKTVREVAKRIMHEVAHHVGGRDSLEDNWHSDWFIEQLQELVMPDGTEEGS